MKFFRKLKEKLFSTSSKLNNGLEEIVDKQKHEILNQQKNENEDSKNHISLNIKEDLRKQKKEIETTSIKDEKRNKVTQKQPSFFEKNKKTNIELDEKQIEIQEKNYAQKDVTLENYVKTLDDVNKENRGELNGKKEIADRKIQNMKDSLRDI